VSPAFVLDASLTLSWAFEDEATPFTDDVLKRLKQSSALAPALWPFEVASVLSTAERQGRIQPDQQTEFLEWLRQLPVAIEHRPAIWLCQQILPLTRAHRLSAYDAAYLELARRESLPLATLDADLQTAARAHGVPLLEAASV
jgi:predicted nucleic acid-binding protein